MQFKLSNLHAAEGATQRAADSRRRLPQAASVVVAGMLALALVCSLAIAALAALAGWTANSAFAASYSASSAKFTELASQSVAQDAEEAATKHVHIFDNAQIIGDAAETELSDTISALIRKHGLDIVIFTDTTTHGASGRNVYAADFYEANGYGVGSTEDGMVFFICMEEGNRGWYTAVKGNPKQFATSSTVNYVDDAIEPYMKALDFDTAADVYLKSWDSVFSGTANVSSGSGSSAHATGSSGNDVLQGLGISLVVAIAVGVIAVRRRVKQMKTIAVAQEARAYMVAGSLRLDAQSDRYTGTTVIRTPKPKNDDRGGGKSGFGGFSSSGGGSFSGGGRSF